MGITVLCASVYMWYKKTEYFPLGMREVRPLLVARGLFGFFGVFGMYCKSVPLLNRYSARCLLLVACCLLLVACCLLLYFSESVTKVLQRAQDASLQVTSSALLLT